MMPGDAAAEGRRPSLADLQCPQGAFSCRHLERRLVEMQRVDTLGALASGIAHDFSNVLTGMLGAAAQLAAELGDGHPALAQVDLLRGAAQRARSLVAHMLSFGRPASEPHRWHSLQGLVHEAAALLRPSVPSRAALVLDLPATPVELKADAAAVIQVVLNLCLNALHALPQRKGTVTVSLSAQLHDPQARSGPARLCLCVSDDGVGMDEALQRRIFEPYFTTRSELGGTGLGLATVQHVVQAHGGHITLRSAPGQGSQFSVWLQGQCMSPDGEEAEPVPPLAPPGPALRVLFVDDDPVWRLIGPAALERHGHAVQVCDSGAAAWTHWREDPFAFDVVVSDHQLEAGSGLELAQAMRVNRPDLPFVLLSGLVTPELERAAAVLGVQHVLGKDGLQEALPQALRTLG